jgi:hypothetical protein
VNGAAPAGREDGLRDRPTAPPIGHNALISREFLKPEVSARSFLTISDPQKSPNPLKSNDSEKTPESSSKIVKSRQNQ